MGGGASRGLPRGNPPVSPRARDGGEGPYNSNRMTSPRMSIMSSATNLGVTLARGVLSPQEHTRPLATQDNSASRTMAAAMKERFQCMCEGGKMCTREDPSVMKGRNDIPNLHANWVTDDLLAMARPWQTNLMDTNCSLLLEFKRSGIGMVMNLQELGEHAHCGPGVLPHTGFSYDPESFMFVGIHVYNGAWRDMGTPTMAHLMRIVQIMAHFTSRGSRVAVHCHAGLGRTGLAIAACLVYEKNLSATEAVRLVRRKRHGALQTRSQEHMVHTFEQYVKHLRLQFIPPAVGRKGVLFGKGDTGKMKLTATINKLVVSSRTNLKSSGSPGTPARGPGRDDTSSSSNSSVCSDSKAGHSSWSRVRNHVQQQQVDSSRPSIDSKGQTPAGLGPGSLALQASSMRSPLRSSSPNPKRVSSSSSHPPEDLEDVLERQRNLIAGEERRELLHVPKFLDAICKTLKDRAEDCSLEEPLWKEFYRFHDMRQAEAFKDIEALHPGKLEWAKAEINKGRWRKVKTFEHCVVFMLLELWLSQLARPRQEHINGFVNAVGVIRAKGGTVSSPQVAELAVKHLSITMRQVVHRISSCCVSLSSGARSDSPHPSTRWLVSALMRHSSFLHEDHTGEIKWDHFNDGQDDTEELCEMLEELFTFFMSEPYAMELLVPECKRRAVLTLGDSRPSRATHDGVLGSTTPSSPPAQMPLPKLLTPLPPSPRLAGGGLPPLITAKSMPLAAHPQPQQ